VFGNVELSAPDKLEEERALVAEEKLRKKLIFWRLVGDKSQGFFG
jgi:hypothetical protein